MGGAGVFFNRTCLMRISICVLVSLLIFLQYRFWSAHGGLWQTFKLRQALVVQQKFNYQLTKRNQELAERVYQLKHDKNSLELLAREKLGMIKSGEQYYRVINSMKTK